MRDVDTLVQSFRDAYNGHDKEEETINDNEFEEDEADTEFIADSMASGPCHDKIIAAKAFVSTRCCVSASAAVLTLTMYLLPPG